MLLLHGGLCPAEETRESTAMRFDMYSGRRGCSTVAVDLMGEEPVIAVRFIDASLCRIFARLVTGSVQFYSVE